MDRKESELDRLLGKSGFLRCQVEVTEYILSKEQELIERLRALREELNKEKSLLRRQELLMKVAKWTGEADALRTLWHYISALKWTSTSDQ